MSLMEISFQSSVVTALEIPAKSCDPTTESTKLLARYSIVSPVPRLSRRDFSWTDSNDGTRKPGRVWRTTNAHFMLMFPRLSIPNRPPLNRSRVDGPVSSGKIVTDKLSDGLIRRIYATGGPRYDLTNFPGLLRGTSPTTFRILRAICRWFRLMKWRFAKISVKLTAGLLWIWKRRLLRSLLMREINYGR